MNRGRLFKLCVLLLVCLLLAVSLLITFALATRADCCVQVCAPCLNLVKLQESLRRFGGSALVLAGLFITLLFSLFLWRDLLHKQQVASLVALKARLNH